MNNADHDETRPMKIGDETMPVPASHSEKHPPTSEADTVAIPIPSDGAADFESTSPPEAGAPGEAGPQDELEPQPDSGMRNGDLPPIEDSTRQDGSRLWRWLILASLVALLVVAGASAYGGYLSGIDQRTQFESTQVAGEVDKQFRLGVEDMQAGRYEVARQRFEYVIQLNPGYPGVTERLAEVLLELNTTATPTAVATPTLTPTVDLRGAEELFSQAQLDLADERWTEAIDTLLKLRKDEPSYQAVEVDSMLYVALRNRGVYRILNEADLEGGTYDLALAERFGPLDVEASNMRTWADLYTTGVSFWGLDWGQAASFFGQLIPVAPNLRDASNLTATERFRLASIEFGDQLAEEGEWCLALEQYEAAFNYGEDPAVQPTAEKVANECADADDEDDEDEDRDEEDGDQQEQPTEGTPPPEGETTPSPETTPEPTEEVYPAPTP